ncbi:hypothetical protein QFC24_006788 [Naganishia onofrii]|uniref:Uncharacterized protein n=1 Tax=Naganishia onofrii TaxID=1851511 RepID=A0ACC2WXW8_9TREE|nr:hypothetical protein QFC24_006788 [Naganishia onofrii]
MPKYSHSQVVLQYTSQPSALYTAPIATQQVSGTQAMGVQLFERLGSMASQPVYTTRVVSRIPQPDQLRGGKKGKGAATKPTAASALKPVQVGVPTNGNRIFYIPITQWLKTSGRVFAGSKDLAGIQSDWLVEKGYGPTMELYAGMTATDVGDVIRTRLGAVAPIYDFVFVKHGPSGKTLASGDVRRLSDLEHGAISLSQFFRSCRYCFIFDANFREPTPGQLAFEEEFLKQWELMTEKAKTRASGEEDEEEVAPSKTKKRHPSLPPSAAFPCNAIGCPMGFPTAETLQHHSSRCDYQQNAPTEVSHPPTSPSTPDNGTGYLLPDGLLQVSPRGQTFRASSVHAGSDSSEALELDFHSEPSRIQHDPHQSDHEEDFQTDQTQRPLRQPVLAKHLRSNLPPPPAQVSIALKSLSSNTSSSATPSAPGPIMGIARREIIGVGTKDRKPLVQQASEQSPDFFQAFQHVVQNDPGKLQSLFSQLLGAQQGSVFPSSAMMPAPSLPLETKPTKDELDLGAKRIHEVIEISSDEEEDEHPKPPRPTRESGSHDIVVKMEPGILTTAASDSTAALTRQTVEGPLKEGTGTSFAAIPHEVPLQPQHAAVESTDLPSVEEAQIETGPLAAPFSLLQPSTNPGSLSEDLGTDVTITSDGLHGDHTTLSPALMASIDSNMDILTQIPFDNTLAERVKRSRRKRQNPTAEEPGSSVDTPPTNDSKTPDLATNIPPKPKRGKKSKE